MDSENQPAAEAEWRDGGGADSVNQHTEAEVQRCLELIAPKFTLMLHLLIRVKPPNPILWMLRYFVPSYSREYRPDSAGDPPRGSGVRVQKDGESLPTREADTSSYSTSLEGFEWYCPPHSGLGDDDDGQQICTLSPRDDYVTSRGFATCDGETSIDYDPSSTRASLMSYSSESGYEENEISDQSLHLNSGEVTLSSRSVSFRATESVTCSSSSMDYLKAHRIGPLLVEMTTRLLSVLPEEPLRWIEQWLLERCNPTTNLCGSSAESEEQRHGGGGGQGEGQKSLSCHMRVCRFTNTATEEVARVGSERRDDEHSIFSSSSTTISSLSSSSARCGGGTDITSNNSRDNDPGWKTIVSPLGGESLTPDEDTSSQRNVNYIRRHQRHDLPIEKNLLDEIGIGLPSGQATPSGPSTASQASDALDSHDGQNEENRDKEVTLSCADCMKPLESNDKGYRDGTSSSSSSSTTSSCHKRTIHFPISGQPFLCTECGRPSTISSTKEDLRAVGNGSSGAVFLLHASCGCSKALKIISRNPCSRCTSPFEATLLEGLRHDNIIRIDLWWKCERFFFLCMPYLRPLAFDNKKQLSLDVAQSHIRELISAAAYLHKNHIAHCDIKIANILIDHKGKAILADFGSAQKFDNVGADGLLMTRIICGTRDYTAPETILTADASNGKRELFDAAKADMWSIGIVMRNMLNSTPFGPTTDCEMRRAADELLVGLLTEDPNQRFKAAVASKCKFLRTKHGEDE